MILQRQKLLVCFPLLCLTLFVVPIIIGLLGTWIPAFGFLPALGYSQLCLSFFRDFFTYPAIWTSIALTLFVGMASSLISLAISLWIVTYLYGTRRWRIVQHSIAPLLAMPHAAFAIGFAFLVAPSGFLIRLLAPFSQALTTPPDFVFISDPQGLSLTLVLVMKETPFLLFMMMGALSQLPVRKISAIGGSLGYSRFRVWSRLIIPQLFPRIRLPFMAVIAYSLSVVDLGLLVGPSLPPTLAVLINSWFYSPEIDKRLLGAAGASVLCCLVFLVLAASYGGEKLIFTWAQQRRRSGRRSSPIEVLSKIAQPLFYSVALMSLLSFLALLIQSFARRWRYPEIIPSSLSLRFWEKGLDYAVSPLVNTLSIGLISSLLALWVTIGCLEYELILARKGKALRLQRTLFILYIPLLVPQISFLFGIQIFTVFLGVEGQFISMILVHLIFVLPYVFLTLSGSYRSYDERFMQVALCLGKPWWWAFLRVKLPMLARPIAFSVATGFAVSVVQFLPTLYVGAGRYTTITTETVALASGSDKRILAVYALLQFLLPALVYLGAVMWPSLITVLKKVRYKVAQVYP